MKYIILLILTFGLTVTSNAQCLDNGNFWNKSWVSCTTSANPNPIHGHTNWLLYEFEENQYIDSTYIWNANRAGESGWGAKDVRIDYSTDDSTWTSLGGVFTFPQADESATYAGFEGPRFNGVFLKKILITILSTHDGGGCASLAEVQFKIDQTACYDPITWYEDADADGLGNIAITIDDCNQPTGYVANKDDNCDNGALGWDNIAPLFSDNGCTSCHGGDLQLSNLDLRTYQSISSGGNKCGSSILTGTTLVSIIDIGNYSGCGETIFTAMNENVDFAFDDEELAKLQEWVDGGAPEACTDFCSINNAATTTHSVVSNDNSLENGLERSLYVGFNSLTSEATVMDNTNVKFKAGQEINLLPGFQAMAGSDFLAVIDPSLVDCTNNNAQEVAVTRAKPNNTPPITPNHQLTVYPNPFYQSTQIAFTLDSPQEIILAVQTIDGQTVQILKQGMVAEGLHQISYQPTTLNGVYIVVLQTKEDMLTRKVVSIR